MSILIPSDDSSLDLPEVNFCERSLPDDGRKSSFNNEIGAQVVDLTQEFIEYGDAGSNNKSRVLSNNIINLNCDDADVLFDKVISTSNEKESSSSGYKSSGTYSQSTGSSACDIPKGAQLSGLYGNDSSSDDTMELEDVDLMFDNISSTTKGPSYVATKAVKTGSASKNGCRFGATPGDARAKDELSYKSSDFLGNDPSSDGTVVLDDVDMMFDNIPSSTKGLRGTDVMKTASVNKNSCSSGSTSGDSRSKVNKPVKKRAGNEERMMKRQRLLEEKAFKQAMVALNKMYKPGECMKHMYVEIHPSLLEEWYMGDVMREVTATGAHVEANPNQIEQNIVTWSRRTHNRLQAANGQLGSGRECEASGRGLLVLGAAAVAPLVRARRLAASLRGTSFSFSSLTLLVFGTKDYFRSSNQRKRTNSDRMSEIELEMALTDLLVSCNCDSVLVNTASELALHIVQTTKAIAETPYKNAKRAIDNEAGFYMRGDNKKCVAVDKDGHGLSRVWQQMLAVLPLSSLEVSRSIAAHYPSPLSLYRSLQNMGGVRQLSDVGVHRAAEGEGGARRVGGEMARRLQLLFSSQDAHLLLD